MFLSVKMMALGLTYQGVLNMNLASNNRGQNIVLEYLVIVHWIYLVVFVSSSVQLEHQ